MRLRFGFICFNCVVAGAGGKPEMRSHYHGHKMSLWLSLIPQLHRPGSDLPDAAMRHHHFQEDNANYYEGVYQQRFEIIKLVINEAVD